MAGAEDESNSVLSDLSIPILAIKEKLSRQKLRDAEDILILRQYVAENPSQVAKKDKAKMWITVHRAFASTDSKVSIRGVQERVEGLIRKYLVDNRLDEWKTANPGQFGEKEQLLCEILEKEERFNGDAADGKVKKTAAQEKQSRKNQKFQFAAMATLKQRKGRNVVTINAEDVGMLKMDPMLADDLEIGPDDLIEVESDAPSGSAKKSRARGTWQNNLSEFLENSKALEIEKLKLEQRKLDLEERREDRLSAKRADQRAHFLATTQALTGFAAYLTNLQK